MNIKLFNSDDLKAYDNLIITSMTESSIALGIWKEVLRELDKRNLVELTSGSYDDPGNAYIKRLWE